MAPPAYGTEAPWVIERIRADFPAPGQRINGKPRNYFDNGASSHSPRAMIEWLQACYSRGHAKIHSSHALGKRVTELYEGAWAKTARLINAEGPKQLIWCDVYALSWDKMYGPTGVGVLYGRGEWLECIAPQHGGSAITERGTFERRTPKDVPYRFEAGIPSIAEAIAFGVSIDYLQGLGMERIAAHEELLDHDAT